MLEYGKTSKELLKEIRVDILCLTQMKMAKKIHRSKGAISLWESGHRQPTSPSIEAINELLEEHYKKEKMAISKF